MRPLNPPMHIPLRAREHTSVMTRRIRSRWVTREIARLFLSGKEEHRIAVADIQKEDQQNYRMNVMEPRIDYMKVGRGVYEAISGPMRA
jgi:hypothetical protein